MNVRSMLGGELFKDILRPLLEAVGGNGYLRVSATPTILWQAMRGFDRLDAICMMLIAIGEGCKHHDKITDGGYSPAIRL